MSRIRSDHLAWAVSKLNLPDEEKKSLINGVLSNKQLPRANALAHVEKALPNERTRLEDLWSAYSRQSLFLWKLPTLDGYESHAELRHAVGKAIQRQIQRDVHPSEFTDERLRLERSVSTRQVTIIDEDDEEAEEQILAVDPRVVSIHMTDATIDATVRLTKHLHIIFEDKEQAVPITQDVGLSVEIGSKGRLTKVFGGELAARKAVRAFLEWISGEPLPPRNPALGKHMQALKFTEDHVKAMADRLELDLGGMSGADARDVVGLVRFEGKPDGYKLAPLDLNDDRIKSQEDQSQDVRIYNWDYEHPADGFLEYTRVAFQMEARHSHLNFLVRTSKAAMADVVRELYTEVTRGG